MTQCYTFSTCGSDRCRNKHLFRVTRDENELTYRTDSYGLVQYFGMFASDRKSCRVHTWAVWTFLILFYTFRDQSKILHESKSDCWKRSRGQDFSSAGILVVQEIQEFPGRRLSLKMFNGIRRFRRLPIAGKQPNYNFPMSKFWIFTIN